VRGNHTASGSSEAYVDTASPNTRYQYRVRACTVVGCSAWREAAAMRTPAS